MKFTKLLCIVLALFTVLSLAACGGDKNNGKNEGTTTPEATTPEVTTPESSGKDTDPVGSSSESDTEPVTPPASSSEDEPDDPAENYVIPADGKISLGDGANGISFPFAAGVLTGLKGDNFAVAAMGKLNDINWFTKVVNPIGGFTGNWQLTDDSNLNQFTAGGYGDIQMFYHIDANNNNWVFGPDGSSKGQAIIIKFTAPADGTYSYTITGRDWTAGSDGSTIDVHIGENMHNWWDMMRMAGTDHSFYKGQQTSSEKTLTAGTNVYFIIRRQYNMTVTAISEFVINYTPAA